MARDAFGRLLLIEMANYSQALYPPYNHVSLPSTFLTYKVDAETAKVQPISITEQPRVPWLRGRWIREAECRGGRPACAVARAVLPAGRHAARAARARDGHVPPCLSPPRARD